MKVKDNRGKFVYVTFTDDVGENKGGYYCEVYSDVNCDTQIDFFCIHIDYFGGKPISYEQAEDYARKYVKNGYNHPHFD